jgi:mono/diheme cytochrome c family protein
MIKSIWALGTLLMALAPTCASAASPEPGLQVAIEKCSGCHAIREEGPSPNPHAPPLRTLNTRYPIDALRENFLKGMEVGHQDMPILILAPEDVTNLLVYLRSLDPCSKPSSDKVAMAKCFAPMGTSNK